jgi:hypothetical protein
MDIDTTPTGVISRILHENELMLKRLQNSQSNYNVSGWEQDRK